MLILDDISLSNQSTFSNFRFKKDLTLSTYQHVFFRKQVSRKTKFIIYGLSRINRIINDLVVFNLGPKLRNGPIKRFGFFLIHFFLELALTLAMISKTQVNNGLQKRKCQSISSKIKAYINIIFYLNTIIAFHCVYMYFVYKYLLA